MRANGLSGFPDPRSGPDGGGVGFPGGFIITGPDSISVMGIPFSGPAVVRAEKACAEYMPPKGPPPAISASQKRADIAEAHCMRTHGVPNFPDPTFSGGGQAPLPSDLNPDSPAFKHAAEVCGARGGLAFAG